MTRATFSMSMLSIATLVMGQLRGPAELKSHIRMNEHSKSESTLRRKDGFNNMFKGEWEVSRSRMGARDLLFHFANQSPTTSATKEVKMSHASIASIMMRRRKMMMRTKRPTPSPTETPTSSPTVATQLPTNAPTNKDLQSTATEPPTPTTASKLGQNDIVYGLQTSCSAVDSARYNICLDLVSLSGSRGSWMDTFARAKQRWESIIVGDQPNIASKSIKLPAGTELCTGLPPTVDDVYICGREDVIDGLDGIIGWGGPTLVRGSGVTNPRTGEPYYTTVTGRMKFDTVDIPRLVAFGEFEDLVLHEMGHALGIGILWEMNGLYTNGSGEYASGTRADAEWKNIGCSGPLPVELDYGEGTMDGHWDEECLFDELMTGVSMTGRLTGALPISAITVGSLEDIGLVVDYSQADPFTIGDLGMCGYFCPEKNRRLHTGKGKVKLNSNELNYIKRFAKSELVPPHQELMAAASRQDDTNDEILVFSGISVLFRDAAGHLHGVYVTWNDVKDSDF